MGSRMGKRNVVTPRAHPPSPALRIAEICLELERLGKSNGISVRAAAACAQAASLIRMVQCDLPIAPADIAVECIESYFG